MNKLNDNINQDINTIFDTFDHAYGKWAGPNNDPEQFLRYLSGDYSTKYLNLRNTRYLTPQHIEAFLKLKSKDFEAYNQNLTIPKKPINIKESTIDLNSSENRRDYIKHLKKLKENYEFVEAMQKGSKDMNLVFDESLHQVFTQTRKDNNIKGPITIRPFDGLFLYTGKILSENNSKEFIYYMGKNIIKFSKKSGTNEFISGILRDELKIRYKSCINPNMYNFLNVKKIRDYVEDGYDRDRIIMDNFFKNKAFSNNENTFENTYSLERRNNEFDNIYTSKDYRNSKDVKIKTKNIRGQELENPDDIDLNPRILNSVDGYQVQDMKNFLDDNNQISVDIIPYNKIIEIYNLFMASNSPILTNFFGKNLKNIILNIESEILIDFKLSFKKDYKIVLDNVIDDVKLWNENLELAVGESHKYYQKELIVRRLASIINDDLLERFDGSNEYRNLKLYIINNLFYKAFENLKDESYKSKYICYRENEPLFYDKDNLPNGTLLREKIRIENYLINIENINTNKIGVNPYEINFIENLKISKKLIKNKDLRILNKTSDNFNELYLFSFIAACNNYFNFTVLSEHLSNEKMPYAYFILNLKNNLLTKYENYNFNSNKLLLNKQSKQMLNYFFYNNKNLFTVQFNIYKLTEPFELTNPFQHYDERDYDNGIGISYYEVFHINKKNELDDNYSRKDEFMWKLEYNNIGRNINDKIFSTNKIINDDNIIDSSTNNLLIDNFNLYFVGIYFGFDPNNIVGDSIDLNDPRNNKFFANPKNFLRMPYYFSRKSLKSKYLCISPVFEIQDLNGKTLYNFIL